MGSLLPSAGITFQAGGGCSRRGPWHLVYLSRVQQSSLSPEALTVLSTWDVASRQLQGFTFFGFSFFAYSSEKTNSKQLISSKNVSLSSSLSPADVQFALAHGFSSFPGRCDWGCTWGADKVVELSSQPSPLHFQASLFFLHHGATQADPSTLSFSRVRGHELNHIRVW